MVNKPNENFISTNFVVLQVSLGTNRNWNLVFLNAKTIKSSQITLYTWFP